MPIARRSLAAAGASAALALGLFAARSGAGTRRHGAEPGRCRLRHWPHGHQPDLLAEDRGCVPCRQPLHHGEGADRQLERFRYQDPDDGAEPAVSGHHRGRLLLELCAGRPALQGERRAERPVQPDAGFQASSAAMAAHNTACPSPPASRAFFYNKKLFAQAGIAAPPKTWDELMTDAGKIEAHRQDRLRHAARA